MRLRRESPLAHRRRRLPERAVDGAEWHGPTASRHAIRDTAPPPLPAGIVLCIEDQPISVDVVEAMLSTYPRIRLSRRPTGREGVRLVRSERPDLVLLDMNLPTSVASRWSVPQRGISTHGLRLVLLTSDTFSIDVVKAMSLGAQEYWPKPLGVEDVHAGLCRVMGENPSRP
jgi:DNA-binding NarL/FixJ family response regulator